VYPETKGVPLEEMDAVFGEGKPSLPETDNLPIDIHPAEHDKDAVEVSAADGATLLRRRTQNPLHLENGTYYPPVPDGTPTPRSFGRGWLGRLFQYRDPGSAPYHAVREIEELAPLHRLHDPDPDPDDDDDGDVDNEESRLSSTEFEMVDREGDVRQ
jgi:hypothetical protein